MDSIKRDNTWTQTVLRLDKDSIPCKVILKQKMDEKGPTARYKGRLVAKGYVKKDGVDYDETFAPVTSFDVILLIVGKFTSVGCHGNHADISAAFLNEDIDGELHVQWKTSALKYRRVCRV